MSVVSRTIPSGLPVSKSEWIWMPHAGHLIVGRYCRFHLNTYIPNPHNVEVEDGGTRRVVADRPGYVISTVGEYFPPDGIREILAQRRGVVLQGRGDAREADYLRKMGFEEIGYNRKYETMVFSARANADPEGQCCPFRMSGGEELDMNGYKDPAEAYEGHLKMCEKWAGPQEVVHLDLR